MPIVPTITGDTGRLTWGYQVAAVTGRFEIVKKGDEFRLRARVAEADPFRLGQAGLMFEVTVRNATLQEQVWKWPVSAITVKDGVIEGLVQMQKAKG